MTEDQRELLEEARDSIGAAKLLVSGEYPGYAASRAYYAMFYIAEAFLEGEGMSFSKHSAIISAFEQHFAHAGKVPLEFHQYLREAHDLRQIGDYGERDTVTEEQAQKQISRAEQFLALAERLLGPVSEKV
jgi:uncharacterized protein (UPF0332 family)